MSATLKTEVLVVGAGPTGLVLSLWLTKLGVRVRLIDRSGAPGETSRAMAVQARTMEFHQQTGLTDDVLASGIQGEGVQFFVEGSLAARVNLKDAGKGVSPFPYVLFHPQDEHERVLLAHLEALGVRVERGTELSALTQDEEGATAEIVSSAGKETVRVPYVVGCDGASSKVRHALGIEFPGGTYQQLFFVADAMLDQKIEGTRVHVCFGRNGFCLVFPLRRTGAYRLLGLVPKAVEKKERVTFEDVSPLVTTETGYTVKKVNWFSTYHSHHRVARQFRRGRVFLAGDAGHIHSPAGGQGMNTGIGDAVNLAWKLAAVIQKRATFELLATYEPERIAFARRLVSTTDRAFRAVSSRSPLGVLARTRLFPILARALGFARFRQNVYAILSQTRIRYRRSRLSVGHAGRVHGGDRLPWVNAEGIDNFAPLTTLDWQIHVYGALTEGFEKAARRNGITLNVFPWSDVARKVGLAPGAVYLVRPDGYVALALAKQEGDALERYLTTWKIRARAK